MFDTKDDQKPVLNLGKPINGSADDFSFIIDEKNKCGYFASNRPGGKGFDDIYEFVETKPIQYTCKTSITGHVKEENTDELLPNVSIKIVGQNNQIVREVSTTEEGVFNLENIDCDEIAYKIIVSKKGYEPFEKEHLLSKDKHTDSLVLSFKLRKEQPKKGIDLAKKLNLKSINFDLGKSAITKISMVELDKVVSFLEDYPNVKIEVGSHTDSRGSDVFNLRLSTRRAKETAQYLIDQGIDISRISYKGYGETVPLNNCTNGKTCTDKEHALNRRSEFLVVQ